MSKTKKSTKLKLLNSSVFNLFLSYNLKKFLTFFSEAPGAIVSLSTQYHQESEQIKVLVLSNKSEKEISEGNVLLLLTLLVQQLTGY